MHNPVILESKSSLLGVNNCTKRLYDTNQVKVPQGWTLIHELTHSLTHLLTYSLTHLLIHLLTHLSTGISNGCIACDLRGLFIESTFECTLTTAPIVPSNLLFSVWNHANYMAGYEQQDAHEFLIALLDGLSVHLEKYHGEASTHKTNNSLGTHSLTYSLTYSLTHLLTHSLTHYLFIQKASHHLVTRVESH